MNKNLFFCIFLIVPQIAVAQWHYSVSVTTNGCGYLDKSIAESQVKYWMGEGYKTFSNKNECEQSRMFVMSQSYTDGSCRVKYIASPCTGPVSTTGNANAFNSNNGSSFYSANPVNEILDWSNDYVERMLALNPEFYPKEQKTVATGDIAFDNLIERMPYSDEAFSGRMPRGSSYVITDGNISAIRKPAKGQGILVPDDFTSRPFNYGLGEWSSSDFNFYEMRKPDMNIIDMYLKKIDFSNMPAFSDFAECNNWIRQQFNALSGLDIESIMQKTNRKEEEKQMLINYREFIDKTYDHIFKEIDNLPEKREIDYAVIAYDCYGNDEKGYIGSTNYVPVNVSTFPKDSPLRGFADAIEIANKTAEDTGVKIKLYFNENTNSYVLACAGTDDMADVVLNDAPIAVGAEVPQYILAKSIANAVNSAMQRMTPEERASFDLTIVGHSLGGGLASVIGLMTGVETKTYNAAKVPNSFLEECGVLDKVKAGNVNNITRYHTSSDLLTNAQKVISSEAIGKEVNIGNPNTWQDNMKAMTAGAVGGTVASLLGPAGSTAVGAGVGSLKGDSKSALAGAVGGLVASAAGPVYGTTLGYMGQGHRMEPVVRHFMGLHNNIQNIWSGYKKEQRRINDLTRSESIILMK